MNPVEFKDLPGLVGQEVGVSDWVEISQERVNQFAEATGDHQWIHVDVERGSHAPEADRRRAQGWRHATPQRMHH